MILCMAFPWISQERRTGGVKMDSHKTMKETVKSILDEKRVLLSAEVEALFQNSDDTFLVWSEWVKYAPESIALIIEQIPSIIFNIRAKLWDITPKIGEVIDIVGSGENPKAIEQRIVSTIAGDEYFIEPDVGIKDQYLEVRGLARKLSQKLQKFDRTDGGKDTHFAADVYYNTDATEVEVSDFLRAELPEIRKQLKGLALWFDLAAQGRREKVYHKTGAGPKKALGTDVALLISELQRTHLGKPLNDLAARVAGICLKQNIEPTSTQVAATRRRRKRSK